MLSSAHYYPAMFALPSWLKMQEHVGQAHARLLEAELHTWGLRLVGDEDQSVLR